MTRTGGQAIVAGPVVILATVPLTLVPMEGYIAWLVAQGADVHIVSRGDAELRRIAVSCRVVAHEVAFVRRTAPFADMKTIVQLIALFIRLRPTVVHAVSPKAGVLAMCAGAITSISSRIYHVVGAPFETARGFEKPLLIAADRFACALATDVWCVSESVRSRLAEIGVPMSKMSVPVAGSLAGVDSTAAFSVVVRSQLRAAARVALGIDADAILLGYVGRLARDKGIEQLVDAWPTVQSEVPAARLLVVGDVDERDSPSEATLRALGELAGVIRVRSTRDIARYYAAMDVLVLPSYREGLPNVVLEAAAMGVPCVATRVTGCVDAIISGVTGEFVSGRSTESLANALVRYCNSPELRANHGAAANAFVRDNFQPAALFSWYRERYAHRVE